MTSTAQHAPPSLPKEGSESHRPPHTNNSHPNSCLWPQVQTSTSSNPEEVEAWRQVSTTLWSSTVTLWNSIIQEEWSWHLYYPDFTSQWKLLMLKKGHLNSHVRSSWASWHHLDLCLQKESWIVNSSSPKRNQKGRRQWPPRRTTLLRVIAETQNPISLGLILRWWHQRPKTRGLYFQAKKGTRKWRKRRKTETKMEQIYNPVSTYENLINFLLTV